MANREVAIARYAEHVAEVKAAVPAEKLLEFSVDQGWAPLYKFLGVPVPESEFPNVNDRAAFQKTIADITKSAYFILGLGAIALGAILYGIVSI
jgi:UDP-N-acetylenolpyruvoylglucosamine reductase